VITITVYFSGKINAGTSEYEDVDLHGKKYY